MDKVVDIVEYFPNIIRGTSEFEELAIAENPEITKLWIETANVMDDQFIDTLSENGIKRWEKMMNIKPLDTDNLDVRRFRIKARYNEQPPYTMATLKTQLERLCGEGGYLISMVEYLLEIKIDLGIKKKYDEVQKMLVRMVPCNILIDLTLLFNTYLILSNYTYADLTMYTYQQLREEILI